MELRYAVRDGHRANTALLRQFDAMNAEFEEAFPGYSLLISDAVRLYSVQKAGYQAMLRGETGGVRWANPDSPEAYHVETNPTGPRALDIRDTGADAGVTQYGNARSAWIRDNARRFGFDPRGYREFREPWHLESFWDLDTTESPEYNPAPPKKLEEEFPMNVVLYLYQPHNMLILVDHLNRTYRNLGNKPDAARGAFENRPYTTAYDKPNGKAPNVFPAVYWQDVSAGYAEIKTPRP